jgi:hypothetical protein
LAPNRREVARSRRHVAQQLARRWLVRVGLLAEQAQQLADGPAEAVLAVRPQLLGHARLAAPKADRSAPLRYGGKVSQVRALISINPSWTRLRYSALNGVVAGSDAQALDDRIADRVEAPLSAGQRGLTPRDWARREAARLPSLTAAEARLAALLARRIDARVADPESARHRD